MSVDLGKVLGAARGYRDLARATLAHIPATSQRAHHGFAWIATSIAALEAVADWLAKRGVGHRVVRERIGRSAVAVSPLGWLCPTKPLRITG
jgi:(2S)-methylsuccinyl-CoA dehydrogenase